MPSLSELASNHRPDLAAYETLYKHFHANPELSNQEKETAATVVSHIREKISSDFEIKEKIGGHGVVAILKNGSGPALLLRADMDALPVLERTGLEYASTKKMTGADGTQKPVMHACGHDMHVTALLAALHTLSSCRESWAGTLIAAFQPAEERGTGSRDMVHDGMYDPEKHAVPIPDVCLGGHVVPWRAGTLGTKRGVVMTSADSMRVTLHGRGGHASMPNNLIDPVVMAASTIMKLQTIVSREVAPSDHGVVTVASVQAGDTENIVVDDAHFAVDIRAKNENTRKKMIASAKRIIQAESMAGNAVKEPTIEFVRDFPLTDNDDDVTARLEESFRGHFEEGERGYIVNCEGMGASEDFSTLATANGKPYSFFLYGGTDTEKWDTCEKEGTLGENIPINHSGLFYPVIQPTLTVGTDAYVIGALTWLAKDK